MRNRLMSNEPSMAGSHHLTERQLASSLNMSIRTLQGWRLKGEGPAFEKFGRSVRYAVSTVEAWIAERERCSTSASAAPDLCGIPGRRRTDPLQHFGRGDR